MGKIVVETKKEKAIKLNVKALQDMYDAAFEADCGKIIVAENFKLKLNLENNQKSIILAAKALAKQIRLINSILDVYPNDKGLADLKERLEQIYKQMLTMAKSDFKTIRTKTDVDNILSN